MTTALPEVTNYDPTVYEILTTDAVQGYNTANPNNAANVGIANQAALNLANRTNWLYTNLNLLIAGTTIPPTVAPIASPAFSGTPTVPTPALGDDSLKIANTAFVQSTVSGVLSLSVAGNTNVSLSAIQAGNGTFNFTGALTGNISVIVPNTPGKWSVENNTTGPYTLTLKTAAGSGVAVSQGKINSVFGDGTNVYPVFNDFASLALTGVPTAPTAAPGTNTTQLSTTAFVTAAVSAVTAGFAPLASPTFTGTPAAPTPAQFNNTTDIATTAFVQTAMGNYQNSVRTNTETLTLTAAQAGTFFEYNGAGAGAWTLPPVGNIPNTGVYTIMNMGAGNLTIYPSSSQPIYVGSANNVASSGLVISPGSNAILIGGTVAGCWFAMGSASLLWEPQFAHSIIANGYMKLPGGLIMQWGETPSAISGGGEITISWPISFPNVCTSVTTTPFGSASGTTQYSAACQPTTSGCFMYGNSPSGSNAYYFWIAFGY